MKVRPVPCIERCPAREDSRHSYSCQENRVQVLTDKLREATTAAREREQRLVAQLADAIETLKPFEAACGLGWGADVDTFRLVTLREKDLCQAWQMIHVGSRWRPAAPSTVAQEPRGEGV